MLDLLKANTTLERHIMTGPAPLSIRLAESILFRSSAPLSEAVLSHALGPDVDLDPVLRHLQSDE